MAAERIARELREIEEARAAGNPYACGLAISCNEGNIFDWLCTYTCPQHYVYQGLQRVSPYAGCVLRFRIQFPVDYPDSKFSVTSQRTSDFFHPLITCAPDTGFCAAFIYRVPFLTRPTDYQLGAWSPTIHVRNLLEEGLLPMWADGDLWVAEHAKFRLLPNVYCTRSAELLFDMAETAAVFPHELPVFQGDLRSAVIEQRAQAADKAARAEKELAILAEEAAAPPQPEQSFEIFVKNYMRYDGPVKSIQVNPSFRVHHLRQVISDVTGVPIDRFVLVHGGKVIGTDGMRLISDCGFVAGLTVVKVHHRPSRGCQPYATNGFNPDAAHLLLTDVQRFEHFARRSCSTLRMPWLVHLIGRLSSFILPPPLSLQLRSRVLPPLPVTPVLWIADLHLILVFSGWTMATVRVLLLSHSPSMRRQDAERLVVLVHRRVLGGAGVLRLAGCDPSAPPPPGSRASGFGCVTCQGSS